MKARRLALIGLPLLSLAGCMHPGQCNDLQSVAAGGAECRSLAGDKHAALELGRRYEEGIGVLQDLRQAARQYRIAASFTSGTTYIYSPPVRKGGSGRVMPVRVGPDRAGLPEAQFRLALLYLRGAGVKLDRKRAMRLLQQAAQQGFTAAARKLEDLPDAP